MTKMDNKYYICIEAVRGKCDWVLCEHYKKHIKLFSIEPRTNIKKFCFENDYHKIYNKELASFDIRYPNMIRECAHILNPNCIEIGSLEYEMLKAIRKHEEEINEQS